jgi:hypothetical protein
MVSPGWVFARRVAAGGVCAKPKKSCGRADTGCGRTIQDRKEVRRDFQGSENQVENLPRLGKKGGEMFQSLEKSPRRFPILGKPERTQR